MTTSRTAERLARDAELLWHPYSGLGEPRPTWFVRSAAGVRLELDDGSGDTVEAIDAMASWWCMIHGYRHPALDAALHEQAGRVSHVMFGGLTHEPAIRLAEQLVRITPAPLQHVFFCDSGSVSVEVAVKLALQYQTARGRPERTRILTVRGGYHGDTFTPMSLCDPVAGMHTLFAGVLNRHVFGPRPPAGVGRTDDDAQVRAWASAMAGLAARHRDEVAAIVVEPVLQGAGGMYGYSPACLRVLRELADEHGFLLVLDELATGFGRTGALFASEHAGVAPDVLCVGKALSGGYLPLAATLCTTEVAATVSGGPDGALMHGPTFMANPLACAVASASIDTLLSQDWAATVGRISAGLATALAPAVRLPGVVDVRVIGAVGVVELDRPVDVPAMTRAVLRRGVWVRPFRDLVYTMPPYVCTDDHVAAIGAAITGALEDGVR